MAKPRWDALERSVKQCLECAEWKTLEDFHRAKTGKDGRTIRCGECLNRKRREQRAMRAASKPVIEVPAPIGKPAAGGVCLRVRSWCEPLGWECPFCTGKQVPLEHDLNDEQLDTMVKEIPEDVDFSEPFSEKGWEWRALHEATEKLEKEEVS